MKGVDEFVSLNFDDHDSTFFSCLNLIVHGYSLLEKIEKFSRANILKITTAVRERSSTKVELEDYLRHVLVTNYIEPNRNLFGLDYFQFHSGVEEFQSNIKTGILDIKVTSPLWTGETYFVFECKRLNKDLIGEYVENGVRRFVNNQYYPHSDMTLAGMISFLESSIKSREITCDASFSAIDAELNRKKKEIKLSKRLSKVTLDCPEHAFVHTFKFVYLSHHNRGTVKKPKPIFIYHVVLNYNDIVVP